MSDRIQNHVTSTVSVSALCSSELRQQDKGMTVPQPRGTNKIAAREPHLHRFEFRFSIHTINLPAETLCTADKGKKRRAINTTWLKVQ